MRFALFKEVVKNKKTATKRRKLNKASRASSADSDESDAESSEEEDEETQESAAAAAEKAKRAQGTPGAKRYGTRASGSTAADDSGINLPGRSSSAMPDGTGPTSSAADDGRSVLRENDMTIDEEEEEAEVEESLQSVQQAKAAAAPQPSSSTQASQVPEHDSSNEAER